MVRLLIAILLLVHGVADAGMFAPRKLCTPAPSGLARSDNFNRANENPLGNGNWTQTASWNSMQIVSNQAVPVTSRSASYWSADAFGPDQYSEVKVVTNENTYAGPIARYSNASGYTAYSLSVEYGELRLKRSNGGSQTLNTVIATGITINGKVLKISVSGTGATVTIRAYVDGVQAGSDYSDTDANRLTSGQPGIQSAASGVLDDWAGGEL